MSKTRDVLGCKGGINALLNKPSLAGPTSTTVVTPNNDTINSSAFLDLRTGPEVLTVPKVSGRYVNFQLLDMYTNTVANIGVLTNGGQAGQYAIVGPGWKGTVPRGLVRVDAPTPDVWLLGRTEVDGPSDLAPAAALQRQYRLAPLGDSGSGTTGGTSTFNCASPQPVLQNVGISVLDEISANMTADPPLPQDGPIVRAMAAAGIGPGRQPSEVDKPGARAAYVQGLRVGAQLLRQQKGQVTSNFGGWRSSPSAGTFGTNYVRRAIVAIVGLGEQVPAQAIYFTGRSSGSGVTLSGGRTFLIRFAKGKLPPVGKDGFWSVTMYNSSNFLIANPINRYSIGNRTPGLSKGAGGSVTIEFSPSKPTNPDANWLPSPTGQYKVVLRVYSPAAAVSKGSWKPPTIQESR